MAYPPFTDMYIWIILYFLRNTNCQPPKVMGRIRKFELFNDDGLQILECHLPLHILHIDLSSKKYEINEAPLQDYKDDFSLTTTTRI